MAISKTEFNFGQAVHYHYDAFPPTNLNYGELINKLGNAAAAIARFDQMLKTLRNSDILLAPLRNQEAVLSSRMEGTISTMDEILQYEADYEDEIVEASGIRTEIIETLLYQRALKKAESAMEQGQPLSEHLIRSLHQVLLSFGRGAKKSPGNYKTDQNYIVDKNKRNVLFVPISPQSLQSGMASLLNFLKDESEQTLIKIAIAHLEFEALHPFKDGNGRVGRMLITLMLWQSNIISAPHFYISGYLEERKEEYILRMRNVSLNNDWTSWCSFFLDAVEAQAVRNLEIAVTISQLYENMKPIFGDLLSSRYSINALDFIFANPVFRTNRFRSNSNIPSATARRFLPILTDAGLLNIIVPAAGSRPAMYSFEPMLELVRV